METKRLCVSVDENEKVFLDQYNLSPSALLKSKIQELKCNFDQFAAKELKKANNKLQNFAAQYEKLREFVEEKGLINEFLGVDEGKCGSKENKP